MITEDYVSFETAKLLKEKWFDENTPVNYFIGDGKPRGCVVGEMIYHKKAEIDTHLIACPTLQMAMKWLREVHNLYIEIKISKNTFLWGFRVSLSNGSTSCLYANVFSNYEQACEAAIKYCLENMMGI